MSNFSVVPNIRSDIKFKNIGNRGGSLSLEILPILFKLNSFHTCICLMIRLYFIPIRKGRN